MWSLKPDSMEIALSAAKTISQWNRRGVSLLTGSSEIFSLSHIWQFGLVRQGFSIHTVDCAIRFDAYAIAEEALRNEISPEDIHDKITVSRCFTPYQILDEMYHNLNKQHKPDEIFFILAPAKQFFDGDVAEDEGVFLLKKLFNIFKEFQKMSVPLMIVEKEKYSHSAFQPFFHHTLQLARPLFQLNVTGENAAKMVRKIYSVKMSTLARETA